MILELVQNRLVVSRHIQAPNNILIGVIKRPVLVIPQYVSIGNDCRNFNRIPRVRIVHRSKSVRYTCGVTGVPSVQTQTRDRKIRAMLIFCRCGFDA
jgi:hypothetical protein